MLFFATTIDGLQMGLCFAILALGVYISYSILDFPDLSVDGVFPLGGVCCTMLMLKLGMPPVPAIMLSFLFGFLAGIVTGILHVKFRISKLLCGIIVMTAMLSVTLALTQLLTRNGMTTTIFSFRSEQLESIFSGEFVQLLGNGNRDYMILLIELIVVLAVKVLIDLFFKTKLGYMLRATGDNEKLVVSLGKDVGNYKILGLALANGFVAVSGAVYANLYSSYDNDSGSGKVVLALASVIIGMAVFSRLRHIKDTTAVIFGAIIYSLCLNYLVLVDSEGIYLKLLNAVMFALILIFNDKIVSFMAKRADRRSGVAQK